MQALTTAEVDKVDLMQFQVLNTGDIVYEPPGPPPPLFEDPGIIKVRLHLLCPVDVLLSAKQTCKS